MKHDVARRLSAASSQADIFERLCNSFGRDRRGIEVDFRNLGPATPPLGRGIHLNHPYPAKLLASIPQFFLACPDLVADGLLLDPFCGSGTVPLEGQLRGLRVRAADSNPLARLITRAKLTPIQVDAAHVELQTVMVDAPSRNADVPDVVNLTHWFSESVTEQLGRLRASIEANICPEHRSFFDMCFSSTVRRVSFADPRLSVPVKINPQRAARYGAKGEEVIRRFERLATTNVFRVFWSVSTIALKRVGETQSNFERSSNFEVFENALHLPIDPETVDLIITSPPYVGAQKYVRASSLCLGWLGLTPGAKLRPFERLSIGREHLDKEEQLVDEAIVASADAVVKEIAEANPLRARIAQRYLLEMRAAIREMARTIRIGGHLVLVVGPNLVAGKVFDTPAYLKELCAGEGLVTKLHLIDTIESRGLMTKRNRTAGLIAQESVFVMAREHRAHG